MRKTEQFNCHENISNKNKKKKKQVRIISNMHTEKRNIKNKKKKNEMSSHLLYYYFIPSDIKENIMNVINKLACTF